jgi:REP element-mobilizing transposase RayT
VNFAAALRRRRYVRLVPRSYRLQAPDVVYHVGSRGVLRLPIFGLVPNDRGYFLALLDHVVRKFQWELYAYCLMGNHFHLVLETPNANISDGMQYLKGNYAIWLNDQTGRVGAVFERRFWSEHAESESYALELSRYVALNPVRVGWTKSPDAWRWSSYAATVGLAKAPRFLAAQRLVEWFGGGHKGQVLFAEFVGEGVGLPPPSP